MTSQAFSILLIEENPMSRCFVSSVLQNQGYFVLETYRCHQACQVFEHHPAQFDLVLMEYQDRRFGSHFLLDTIKRQRPDLPIVLCAENHDGIGCYPREGHSVGEHPMDSFFPKPDAFLEKPYTFDELHQALMSFMA